jgi:hypothetical protein
VHDRQQVTTDAAVVRRDHREDEVGGHGRVDGVAAVGEHPVPGGAGEVVGADHDPVSGRCG